MMYLLWHLLISRWRNRKAIAERAKHARPALDDAAAIKKARGE